MSEENKKKTRKIEVDVRHTYEGQPKQDETLTTEDVTVEGETVADIKAERDELKGKFGALAEQEFSEEREATLEALKSSGKFSPEQLEKFEEEIEPSNIEIFKGLIDEDLDEESKPPEQAPMGSVELPTERAIPNLPSGKRYKDEREMVRELYWKAYYDKKASPEEIEDAQRKLRQLWETVLTRTKELNRENKPIEWNFTTWQCPKCLRHVINEPCCSCGFCMKKVGDNYVTR